MQSQVLYAIRRAAPGRSSQALVKRSGDRGARQAALHRGRKWRVRLSRAALSGDRQASFASPHRKRKHRLFGCVQQLVNLKLSLLDKVTT